jgi:hypothetical protein
LIAAGLYSVEQEKGTSNAGPFPCTPTPLTGAEILFSKPKPKGLLPYRPAFFSSGSFFDEKMLSPGC